jgi:protein-S-isoprenylcysteine O-methyltransferase Ste14
MAQVPLQPVLILLLLSCLVSFGWAMRYFFVRPIGMTAGMRITSGLAFLFSILHLAVLLRARHLVPERGWIAVILYLSSLGLFWWAVRVNRRSPLSACFSTDVPSHLTSCGPYRLMRHPFYCSYLATWTATVIATSEWWLLITVAVMFGLYLRAARLEERKFSSSGLDAQYTQYRANTGMFVPNPAKLLRSLGRAAEGASNQRTNASETLDSPSR